MDINVPSYMIRPEDPDQRPTRSVEQPISLKSIRLIAKIKDPETGIKRDVIVKEVARRRLEYELFYGRGTPTYKRYIPGLDVNIPWPKVKAPVYEDYAADTLRIDVEEKTYVPSLLTPPMPSSVIDELRNRYSIFRTRHEPEYIARKQAEEDEKLEKKKMAKKMRTPLNEANRKARKEKKKLGRGKLDRHMMEKIGEVMAARMNLGTDSVVGDVAKPVTA